VSAPSAGRVASKVAFITGAARGLGRAFAIRLAEEGADIIAMDLCADLGSTVYSMGSSAELDGTVRAVEALGRRAVAVTGDVRDFDAMQAGVDAGVAELGRLDLVCANAGLVSYGGVLDLTPNQWSELVDVHVTGSWNTVRAAAPHLIAGGGGSVVFTSSTAGFHAEAGIAHYVTAKHGLVGLMRSFAVELAPHKIRSNSVHPTMTNTQMIQNPATRQIMRLSADETDADVDNRAKSRNLLGVPWIESLDVANAVLYLHSDEARYITGVALPVDAGALLV